MALGLAACGGDDPCDSLTGPVVVTSVEVSGPDGSIPVGATAQLRAVPLSACGEAVSTAPISWSSNNPGVATVSATGVVTAVGPGRATIEAASEGQVGSMELLVEPAAVATVDVVPEATAVTVGDTVRFSAILKDENGNVLTGRAISWSTGNSATATVTSAGLVTGVAPGSVQVIASSEDIEGAGTLMVTAAPLPRLVFITQPSATKVGEVISPAVRVQLVTADGVPITSDEGGPVTIALDQNPGGATLRGTLSAPLVDGVATFSNLNLDRAATGYTLRASRADVAPATSQPFNVAEGDPATLEFTVGPTSTVAGQPITPAVQVTVRDAFGSAVTSWSEPVKLTLASGPAGAVLGGTTEVSTADGVARFTNLRIEQAGANYSLRATTGGLNVTSGTFTISPGAAATLGFGAQPTDTDAGETIDPAVRVDVRDAFGNPVAAWSEPIALTLTGGAAGATLLGTTSRAAQAGSATFGDLSIEASGSGYRLRATSGSLPATESEPFAVAPGGITSVTFTVGPSTVAAGATITPAVVVTVRDEFGNPASGSPSVSLALVNGNGAALEGTTAVEAAAGVATFSDLAIEKAGSGYRLRATAGGQDATSAEFSVTPGPATRLVYLQQPPGSVRDNRDFNLTIGVHDAHGNLVPTNSVVVSLRFGVKPSSLAFLLGNTTRTTSGGRAEFTNLEITRDGEGYTIIAEAPGLASAESDPFQVR